MRRSIPRELNKLVCSNMKRIFICIVLEMVSNTIKYKKLIFCVDLLISTNDILKYIYYNYALTFQNYEHHKNDKNVFLYDLRLLSSYKNHLNKNSVDKLN